MLALCLGLGACGGDDEDGGSGDDQSATTTVRTTAEGATTTEAEGPSLSEFIAAADAICREFNRSFEQLTDAEYYRAWIASDKELAALDPPPEVEIQYEQYLAALKDQLHFTRSAMSPRG